MQAGPPPLWLEGLRTPWASTLAEQGISLQPRNGRKRLDPHLHHFDAIAATLPLGRVAVEAEANERGERLVLEWCKLFADRDNGKHHWRRVVENPDRFEADLYATLGVTADEFTTLIMKIKHYRDKFVAHLDEERTMLLPALEMAKSAIVFLHERLVQQAGEYGDWLRLPTAPEELSQGFAQASREAQSVYAEALARLAVER